MMSAKITPRGQTGGQKRAVVHSTGSGVMTASLYHSVAEASTGAKALPPVMRTMTTAERSEYCARGGRAKADRVNAVNHPRNEEWRVLRLQGESDRAIARQYGVSPSTVSRALAATPVPPLADEEGVASAFNTDTLSQQTQHPVQHRPYSYHCRDCGRWSVFTRDQAAWYTEQGYRSGPRRCKDCRQDRRLARIQKEMRHPTLIEEAGPMDEQTKTKIVTAIYEQFGPLRKSSLDQIDQVVEDYAVEDIIAASESALEKADGGSWAYVMTVLQNQRHKRGRGRDLPKQQEPEEEESHLENYRRRYGRLPWESDDDTAL